MTPSQVGGTPSESGAPVTAAAAGGPAHTTTTPPTPTTPQAPVGQGSDRQGSDRQGSDRQRRRWLLVAAGALTVALLVGGGAAYAYAGDVPRGVRVLGVELGGTSRQEAEQRLRDGLGARVAAPLKVRLGDKQVQLRPADVGAELDVPATVAAATEASRALWGDHTVQPVVRVDAKRLDAALKKAIGPGAVAMTKPAITYAGLTPRPVYPKPGRNVDAQRSADAVLAGWLRSDEVPVPVVETPPATTREEVDRLVAELATPAVAAPVAVRTDGGGAFTLAPAAIAKSLVLTADAAGRITPRVDEKKLRAAAAQELAKVEVKPQEASITLAGGAPKVVASTSGKVVDTAKLSADLLVVLSGPAPRQVSASLVTKEAAATDEDMTRLGVKERVSTFTTTFTGGLSSGRSKNIVRAAKEVDGALVKPGETFSLNGFTGPRGYAEGYVDAPIILDGKLVPAVGGGISQFATTLFNAAYYAGLEDVEHKPHSFWFSRYPSVIESTIFYPTLDLKFRNDTPHGVLIDTSFTSKSVTVSMWSTKVYDSVKTQWGPKRNFSAPETIRLPAGPKCIATDGIDGFTQDAWRIFRQGGKEIRRQKFSWRYDPEPRYICGQEPS